MSSVPVVQTPFIDSIEQATQTIKGELTRIEARLPQLKQFVEDCKRQRDVATNAGKARNTTRVRKELAATGSGGYRRKSRKSHKSRKGRKTRKH